MFFPTALFKPTSINAPIKGLCRNHPPPPRNAKTIDSESLTLSLAAKLQKGVKLG